MKTQESFEYIKVITIPGELPDLNAFINATRRNRFLSAKIKKEATEIVAWESKRQIPSNFLPISVPFFVEFHWYCKDKRKDKDNVSFAKKFILDGLQESGVIAQDTWNIIIGFSDYFYIDKNNYRIEVIIKYH